MSILLEKIRSGTSKRYTVESLLGISAADNLELAKRVKSGLSFEALERVSRMTGLSLDQLRVALHIARRTLTRRKQEKKLSPEESDRLVSVSRLLSLTYELFEGNTVDGYKWFTSANRALGGLAPLEAAATEIGSREVENVIGRLEHGVFS